MLRYLFKAEFTDGTFIQQTQEDVSLLENGRNQFYDVLNNGKELKKLTYYEQKIWNPTVISVDFETGNFTLNGETIFTELIKDSKTGREILVKRKPIRYMEVKKHFNVTYKVKNMKVTNSKELPEERSFYIGWEAVVGKKTFRQVMGVK